MERDILPLPYLMGSFGIGTSRGTEYFSRRKSLRVTGIYTQREICLYYNWRNRKEMQPLIDKIIENAQRVDELDKQVNYLM